jgi:hypothetical protein
MFEVPAVRKTVTVCHCSQCRRLSGHLWAATRAPFSDLVFTKNEGLTWYASSDFAKRGFCRCCGSSLFYRLNGEEGVGIGAGSLDMPTGLKVSQHIFCEGKGDYYDIDGDLPQIQTY